MTIELSIPYVAGLFDGEGHISLAYSHRRWRRDLSKAVLGFRLVIGIDNTHLGVLKSVNKQFPGSLYGKKPALHIHKIKYTWRIAGREKMQKFLQQIYPYSVIKQRQIKLALKYIETMGSNGTRVNESNWAKRLTIYEALRQANQRGKVRLATHVPPDAPSLDWMPTKRYGRNELHKVMAAVRAAKVKGQIA